MKHTWKYGCNSSHTNLPKGDIMAEIDWTYTWWKSRAPDRHSTWWCSQKKNVVKMSMKLVVMESCRRFYIVEDCEVLDDRRRQGAFTISLMVKLCGNLTDWVYQENKGLRNSKSLDCCLTKIHTLAVKWKIHEVHYFLSLSKVNFVSAVLKLASECLLCLHVHSSLFFIQETC